MKNVGIAGTAAKTTQPEPIKAFRGRVNMNNHDDRVEADSISPTCAISTRTQSLPIGKTNEEIDRQAQYNQMMGKSGIYGMGYIFS